MVQIFFTVIDALFCQLLMFVILGMSQDNIRCSLSGIHFARGECMIHLSHKNVAFHQGTKD